MEEEKKFELIIALVNSGFSDVVMDAVREEGCCDKTYQGKRTFGADHNRCNRRT